MAARKIVSKKLKVLMFGQEITLKELSKNIGISENSLVQKINGHRSFWYWEMVMIAKTLKIQDIPAVFPEIHEAAIKAS